MLDIIEGIAIGLLGLIGGAFITISIFNHYDKKE